MRSEKELFRLAKDMVFIEDKLQEGCNSMVREELTEEAARIRRILLEKNYDLNTFLHYKDLYKTMTVHEYYDFIKILKKDEEK
jgi:hypothetical protein